MIQAKIIADSINPDGDRLTTFVLTYHRYIHSEFLTHRMFSRNSASSRAIPIWKMLWLVLKNPAKPVYWGETQKGMQSSKLLGKSKQRVADFIWMSACLFSCLFCWLLFKLKVHKQWANRLIEPYSHITTIVTSTSFDNFFALRCHKDAQPEIQALADAMLEEYQSSVPKKLEWGQWHLPFADKYVDEKIEVSNLLKITTARCARISYLNFLGNIDHNKDYVLHDDLLGAGHCSPAEHAGQAARVTGSAAGNFVKGYIQYRKTIPNEHRQIDKEKLLTERQQCKTKSFF